VLFNSRIVIPAALRLTTLQALHAGHLGVVKSRAKARECVWWPKCSEDIQRHVASCDTGRHHAKDSAEPLLPTALPDLPWQKVGTDLFELSNKHYLVVVDYYSRYTELAEIKSQTTNDVIMALKSIFARHGIPMVV
jgi:hypothetical protein